LDTAIDSFYLRFIHNGAHWMLQEGERALIETAAIGRWRTKKSALEKRDSLSSGPVVFPALHFVRHFPVPYFQTFH